MTPEFTEVSRERFDEMLDVLPPAVMDANGFMVGEPFDHRLCEITGKFGPTFAAFIEHKGKCYEATRPLTIGEYKAVKPALVVG